MGEGVGVGVAVGVGVGDEPPEEFEPTPPHPIKILRSPITRTGQNPLLTRKPQSNLRQSDTLQLAELERETLLPAIFQVLSVTNELSGGSSYGVLGGKQIGLDIGTRRWERGKLPMNPQVESLKKAKQCEGVGAGSPNRSERPSCFLQLTGGEVIMSDN